MTTTLHVPDIEGCSPAEAALAYAAAGWYLVPVANGTKHPGSVLGNGWEAKSTRDPEQIARWWRSNPDFGIALHAGKSGVTILDIDHPERLHPAVVRALKEQAPPFQSSRRGQPTKGHAIFLTPEGRDLGNAIGSLKGGWGEIRGRNGVIIAAPSTHAEAIHGDGDGLYEWQTTGAVPTLPEYVADLLPDARDAAAPATTAAVDAFLDAHTIPGDDTRLWDRSSRMIGSHVTAFETAANAGTSRHMSILGHACGAMREAADGLLDARTAADTIGSVFLAYASRQDAGSGKPRIGREAHDEWAEIIAYAVGAASAATPGEGAARVKARADAYKATHGGVSTLARAPESSASWDGDDYHHTDGAPPTNEPWEDKPYIAPPEKTLAELMIDGGTFILDQPEKIPAIWGRDGKVFWAEGESLMIAGSPGVGKTTIAAQVIRGLILGGDVLGLPVQPRKRVLYLASDRPRQIARALGRNLADIPREILNERLVIWPGPPQDDVATKPHTLLNLARAAEADVVVVDSMKDVARQLTEEVGSSGYNIARQLVLQANIEMLELHHTVKRGANGLAPKTLADVYGGMPLTAGAGSVILLHGEAGEPIVDLLHLKQPAEEIGPWKVEHDHDRGVSTVLGGTSAQSILARSGGGGVTVMAVAQGMYGNTDPSRKEIEKARRALSVLVKEGRAVTSGASGTATVYLWVDQGHG